MFYNPYMLMSHTATKLKYFIYIWIAVEVKKEAFILKCIYSRCKILKCEALYAQVILFLAKQFDKVVDHFMYEQGKGKNHDTKRVPPFGQIDLALIHFILAQQFDKGLTISCMNKARGKNHDTKRVPLSWTNWPSSDSFYISAAVL